MSDIDYCITYISVVIDVYKLKRIEYKGEIKACYLRTV
jgi:hypothetical protein